MLFWNNHWIGGRDARRTLSLSEFLFVQRQQGHEIFQLFDYCLKPRTVQKSKMMMKESSCRRGAFILLEGVDRCGKTTQAKLLLQRLLQMGIAAVSMRFPDRTTPTGQIIHEYLQQQSELDDRSIHLLFSSNRWEAATNIQNLLRAGTTIVCDRYAYSGVAFSAAKRDHQTGQPLLDLEWCKAPDRGLPAPDCVLFLDLSPDQAEARGGYVARHVLVDECCLFNVCFLSFLCAGTVENDTKSEICRLGFEKYSAA
jgi:dTMP kinase